MKPLSLMTAVCMALALCSQQLHAKNYVYVLTGQSNSLGAVKGTPATPEQLARYSSHALLWNGNMVRDTGKVFDDSPSWQEVAPQLPSYGNLCMGPEYGFGYMMQRQGWHTKGNNRLYIIKASLDGGGNSFWLPGGAAWKSMTQSIKSAMAAVEGDTKVQALLYLQGESDKGEEITRAPERFLDLLARLQREMKKGPRLAVAGECATWGSRETRDSKGASTAENMYALSLKKKNIGWVRTRDLTKITAGDNMGVHYDGKSQISIGARYAYAVALLEKLPIPPTRGDDRDAPLDSPSAWWGGKLPGAEAVVTWDVASANVEDTLGKDMMVAGIIVQDPFRGAVSIVSKNGAKMKVGAKGLSLRDGGLSLLCDVETSDDQQWEVAAGQKLALGSPTAPVSLMGKGCISISGAEDAQVELHVVAAPEHKWTLCAPGPKVKATIAGKPAELREQDGVYKLELAQ